LSALPQGGAAPADSPAPLAGVGTAISNAGNAVTGFFGNMFSGNATTEPSATVATATAPQAAASPPTPPTTPSVQAPPVANDWSSGMSVSPGSESTPAKAPVKSAAVEKPRAANGSKYRLQVGIVRSREEAEGITATLRSEYAAAIGAASPAIDEVSFGNGTFYRVQVGPFASAAEPRQLCTTLKPKGFDCLVVTK
jgi:cell division protein FtsN